MRLSSAAYVRSNVQASPNAAAEADDPGAVNNGLELESAFDLEDIERFGTLSLALRFSG